jgi:retron-type reverse transcriptase
MYRSPLIIGVSHPPQGVSASADIMQRAKVVKRGRYGNTRYPKALKGNGYGATILEDAVPQRVAGFRTYAKKADITENSSVHLSKHKEENKKNPRLMNNKLIHLIADEATLLLAYEQIKSNPGQMTKGSTDETLDGINSSWFKKTSKLIKAGKFRFSASRRIYIPKPGGKKRPLTIGSPRDKVVQKAMQLVLEPIFEPNFLLNSNGFRPYRGCHTALKQIKDWFHGVTWVIESDISNCFPTLNHRILLSLLRKRISCDKTLALVRNLIETG